jgi:diketogulonate reductase-like aldo/keto reductase
MFSPDLESTGESTLAGLAYELRPWQWYKQVIIYLPVVFAGRAGSLDAWVQAPLGALIFSAVAGSTYILNDVADVALLQAIAANHDATPAQVSLAWLLSKESVAPIPKAAAHDHVTQNWAARDLELTPAEIDQIDALDHQERVVDFDAAPWNHVEG